MLKDVTFSDVFWERAASRRLPRKVVGSSDHEIWMQIFAFLMIFLQPRSLELRKKSSRQHHNCTS